MRYFWNWSRNSRCLLFNIIQHGSIWLHELLNCVNYIALQTVSNDIVGNCNYEHHEVSEAAVDFDKFSWMSIRVALRIVWNLLNCWTSAEKLRTSGGEKDEAEWKGPQTTRRNQVESIISRLQVMKTAQSSLSATWISRNSVYPRFRTLQFRRVAIFRLAKLIFKRCTRQVKTSSRRRLVLSLCQFVIVEGIIPATLMKTFFFSWVMWII